MAKMRKSRTSNIKDAEIDFRVLRFTSHDNAFLSAVGRHSQESRWLVEVIGKPEPVDICVTVDKAIMGSPEVHVSCKGEQVFPTDSHQKAKLVNDFYWRWPFRGTVRGLLVPDAYEVIPEHSVIEHWLPATLTQQTDDGHFKATVKMPMVHGGFKAIELPLVKASNIRDAKTHMPLVIPERELVLDVPVKSPLHPTLSVTNAGASTDEQLLTHLFARRTPPPKKGLMGPPEKQPRVTFHVSKDRTKINASVGCSQLNHFLTGEVRSVEQHTEGKLKKWWRFQIGPFAEHIVQVEKRSAGNKTVTLTVDGEVLCEAKAEDIESRDDWWECHFRFMGERYVDWLVHTCNSEGVPLDSMDTVVQRTVFAHFCSVSFVEDISEAILYIGNDEFSDLPHARQPPSIETNEWAPEALGASFGLVVPYKVDPDAPTGFRAALASKPGGGGGIFDIFGCCANAGAAVQKDDAVAGVAESTEPHPGAAIKAER